MNNPAAHTLPSANGNHAPPPTILLVEDDAIAQRLHQRFLEMLGYQVKLVDTAQAAIDTSAEVAYDIVILDFCLPDKNGDVVIQAIRAREQATQTTTPLPIIVVSADAQQPQLQACLGLGAHQVHEKPISLRVLARALQDCGIVIDIQNQSAA